MSDNKQNRRSFNGKGYYIALILCAAAIGISGYLYEKNQSEAKEVSVQSEDTLEVLLEPTELQEDLPVIAPREETVPQTEAEHLQELPPETEASQKAPMQVMAPVSGQEVMPYAVEVLSFNETTRDWRTHEGVDLSAEEGTEVHAAADGKVYTVYEDDALGQTVVILHDGGYATKYASLREDLQVEAGDVVSMGDTIGYVGTTALEETVLGPHVHWSVTYRDTPMDPADFLKLS